MAYHTACLTTVPTGVPQGPKHFRERFRSQTSSCRVNESTEGDNWTSRSRGRQGQNDAFDDSTTSDDPLTTSHSHLPSHRICWSPHRHTPHVPPPRRPCCHIIIVLLLRLLYL
ncbi:hypothetical protein PAXRUDRAFT_601738 [Paxillus rubicundulus Ve08.2h10]|uniref:Uncharacterized protein n=1 Tax=Paxillus rubicundulus Ve08.2h10 TaxID=930991 RepID=A0A0D0DL97_9AGAM|nr:hypothetical protein PAXRUDRAFT_601738 [Paxillus rubicundulus Ve08.2h10]